MKHCANHLEVDWFECLRKSLEQKTAAAKDKYFNVTQSQILMSNPAKF